MTKAVNLSGTTVEEPPSSPPTTYTVPASSSGVSTSVWSLPADPPDQQHAPVPNSFVEDLDNNKPLPMRAPPARVDGPAAGSIMTTTSTSLVRNTPAASNVPAPISIAMDGSNPGAHFVSLENVARLYVELKNERDFLLRESAKIFSERVRVVNQLRELEAHLNGLLQQKGRLEESLDILGLREEENREKIACMDDKVASISSESARFEATIRDLKGASHPTKRIAASTQPRPRPSAACRRTLYGHTGNVLGLDACSHSSVLITSSADRTIRTWDVTTGRRLDTLYGHEGWVHAVTFAQEGERAVSGSGDKTVKVWDLSDARGRGMCRATLRGHEAGVTCVQLDDNILISGSLDKTLRYTDLGSGSENSKVIHGHESSVYCLQFVGHGVASGSSVIRMHDLRSGVCHRTLKGHVGGAVRALQFNDTNLMISGGTDCTLRFWDLRTGGSMMVLDVGARINTLQFDEQRVVVGCADRTLKVYNLETKEQIGEHGGHLGPVTSIASVDDHFFTGSTDQTAKSWELPSPIKPNSLR